MKVSRKKRQYFIATIDLGLLISAVFFSLWIRDLRIPSGERFSRHISYFIPIIITWVVCFYTAGFYSLEIPHTGYRLLSRLSIIAVICTLLGFAFFYLNLKAKVVPKSILVIYGLIVMALIALWRLIYNRIVLKYTVNTNIAFVGLNDTVIELLDSMKKFSYISYRVMFIYSENHIPGSVDDNVPIINNSVLFIEEIKKNKIQMVVVADKESLPGTAHNILFGLLRDHVYFMNLPEFYEFFMRRIPLEAVNELWFLTNIDLRSKKIYSFIKRSADLTMALIFLIISMPFWPFILLVIKLESSGAAFFRQDRIGYMGRPFTIIKFRTMKITSDLKELAANDNFRITRFGKFLRKTRIDEIPQVLNIIKSDMSFIGPRPERPELIEELEQEIPFYRQRLLVKPGLSGWDQVSGEYHSPSREDTYKKLQYDLYYIKNMSFFLDVSIFFKTLVTIGRRGGM